MAETYRPHWRLPSRLWANPWWAGSILLLLTVYWVSRKLAGMV
jgi:hypothetical protein